MAIKPTGSHPEPTRSNEEGAIEKLTRWTHLVPPRRPKVRVAPSPEIAPPEPIIIEKPASERKIEKFFSAFLSLFRETPLFSPQTEQIFLKTLLGTIIGVGLGVTCALQINKPIGGILAVGIGLKTLFEIEGENSFNLC